MAFSGNGAGTSGDPYQITTIAQLYEIFDNLSSDFILMNNIDASDTSSGAGTEAWNTAAGWVPVNLSVFTGTFDFNSFSISNLYSNLGSAGNDIGLFYETTNNLIDVDIEWTVVGWDQGGAYRRFSGVTMYQDGGTISVNNIQITATGETFSGFCGVTYEAFSGTITKGAGLNPLVNVNVESDNGYAHYVSGVIGKQNGLHTISDLSVQFRCIVSSPVLATAIYNIGGVSGRSIPGTNGACYTQKMRVNMLIDTGVYGKRIGGIIGEIYGTSSQSNITESWAIGEIVGLSGLGGLVGDGLRVVSSDCWHDVSITAHHDTILDSGLVYGLEGVTEAITSAQRILTYSGMTVPNLPNSRYSADVVADGTATIIDVYHNSDNLEDASSADRTRGVGLSTSQFQDQVYMDANTGLDFVSIWESGGYNGYMDLQNNPYNDSLIIYQGEVNITVVAASQHSSSVSGLLTGSQTGIIDSALTSKGIQYGTESGIYTSTVNLANTATFEASIGSLSELDIVYFRAFVVYNGETTYSGEEIYTHYELPQLDITNIVADSYLFDYQDGLSMTNIHGSKIIDVNGVEHVFYSCRPNGILEIDDDVNADFVKINTTDYSDRTTISLVDEEGHKLKEMAEIVYLHGFIWTIGRTGGNTYTAYKYLIRIDPDTLSVVYFKSTGGLAALGDDTYDTDGAYFYMPIEDDIVKLDISSLSGVFVANSYQATNTSVLLATYDHTSQGYALDPRSPIEWNSGTKGTVHSMVVDGEYIYAEYATSSSYLKEVGNIREGETECELHKIRKSDMTPQGYARIPKGTDDMTHNADFCFIGVEVYGGYIPNTADPSIYYSYYCGAYAVRKSDMECFTLNKLHAVDGYGDASWASTVFGDYLIEIKDHKYCYVVDISDPSSWFNVDQFGDPADSNLITGSIGDHTIKVFRVWESYTNPDTNVDITGSINEIHIDSNGVFHSSTYQQSSNPLPGALLSYSIPGISFIAAPIVDTITPALSNGDLILTGSVINENGATVTSVGFEYADNSGFTSSTIINASIGNFTGEITGVSTGTFYIRAWADNSEGRGYGDIETYTFDTETIPPVISNLQITNQSGVIGLSFESNEQLGASNASIDLQVNGPTTNSYATFNRSQFSESETGGVYTYTLNASQSFGDGYGVYTAVVNDALDVVGNDGADGSLSDTYNYEEIIDDYSAYSISGLVSLDSQAISGARVLLISQATNAVVEQQLTDAQGAYTFTNRAPDDDYLIVAYYTSGGNNYSTVGRPYRRFNL